MTGGLVEALLELADRMDADVRELIRDNPANLREKLGSDGYAQLLRGTLQPCRDRLREAASPALFPMPGPTMVVFTRLRCPQAGISCICGRSRVIPSISD